MRRSRLPRTMAVVLAVFAAVLLVPHVGQQVSMPVSHRVHAEAVTTVADVSPSSGGLCSVPGIGDIGGLFGFCALGSSGLIGDLNSACQPSPPDPEPASSGVDAMISPPASGKQPANLYDEYGVAGDYWAATNLQCSDMTSLIGNNVAGMVFDAAKSLDRVTITIYQAAAGEGILGWLQRVTDKLITSLGKAIYFPYLAVVVILASIWLAWQGLIRKRGTRTIEGTIWMIVACAAAIFLIGKPAAVTGVGRGVSDGISQALNAAFAKLPSPGPSSCVPVQKGDPQAQPATYSYTSGNTVVDQNADELWTVLVCKPWLVGEFGTSNYASTGGKATAVNQYGRSLLWAQAIAVNERATPALIQAKQAAYAGIAKSIQSKDPADYPLFQGKQWTSRLEVAFAALFAAVVAGVLVLLIAVTLILLKLSFLLLLIVGPFFLLIGTHPGFGRIVALRWVEMLVGVLLKQAAVALVLSVLLYCYALIMGTGDSVLPWALKILMIALVTVAAFIYRKPFQHLFSAVGYGVLGGQERADASLQRAGATARTNSIAAATLAPPFAAYRAARWARRNPAQAASLVMAGGGGTGAAVAAGLRAADTGSSAADEAAGADGLSGPGHPGVAKATADGGAGRLGLTARARALAAASGSSAEPPPLNLPARNGSKAGIPSGFGAAVSSRRTWPGAQTQESNGVAAPSRVPPNGESERQAPERSRGQGQAGMGSAQRVREPAAPRRLRGTGTSQGMGAGRQPAARRTQNTGRSAGQQRPSRGAGRDEPQSREQQAKWLGQPMSGPLAGSGATPDEQRSVPFWLRPVRRK